MLSSIVELGAFLCNCELTDSHKSSLLLQTGTVLPLTPQGD